MKKLVVGIIAHVDSGKTTLSEAMLYNAGEIKRLGRVDMKDSFLDNNSIERERGITIFSKQAELKAGETEITLLDTPGHVDFTAETERVLRVLDYAILVISGSEGVQSHTETLWRMLEHYNIPTFIFINKMDLPNADHDAVLSALKSRLSDGCIEFDVFDDNFYQYAAMQDERLLDEYMDIGVLSGASLSTAILSRRIFPCYFGSALKDLGVDRFISALDIYTVEKVYPDQLRGRVYKISEDERGNRLTHIKLTGGSLKVRDTLDIGGKREKINEIRIYSGAKFVPAYEISAGQICAVTGISSAIPGDGFGSEYTDNSLLSFPVFTYAVRLPEGVDATSAYAIFQRLEQEETQMHVSFNEHLQSINVQIMGDIQLEVLKRVLDERFALKVEFEHGSIIYKETISDSFEGVGHYEPLRHYAEVHLKMSPGERGSGLIFDSECGENELDRNWQRLILTHLAEKTHLGVLTGSPITDMRITLVSGRASNKHTEGGDFRQSTYRAVRQGLMQARSKGKCVLLEPWYAFALELPTENVGRAMTDLSQMMAEYEVKYTSNELSIIEGKAPVSRIRDYNKSILSYTHGKGKLSYSFSEYGKCIDEQELIADRNYDPEADLMNTPDSVFCSSGAGFLVKWHDVFSYMHLPLLEDKKEPVFEPAAPRKRDFSSMIADEAEILRIFESTYGKIKPRVVNQKENDVVIEPKSAKNVRKATPVGPTYLLIDGYNIIFAWDDLKSVARESLELARTLLIDRICNYQAMRQINVIVVFDAYKVKGGTREIEKIHGVSVVYTKEAETADRYIEKTATELSKSYRVRVATSDAQIQMIIFGSGAARVTPRELYDEVCAACTEMRELIDENNRK